MSEPDVADDQALEVDDRPTVPDLAKIAGVEDELYRGFDPELLACDWGCPADVELLDDAHRLDVIAGK